MLVTLCNCSQVDWMLATGNCNWHFQVYLLTKFQIREALNFFSQMSKINMDILDF